MVSIRAVYQDGRLRLLEPVNLQEGEEVQIQIVKPAVRLADAAADMLVRTNERGEDVNEAMLQQQLDAVLKGKRPLSEIIIADRHEDV